MLSLFIKSMKRFSPRFWTPIRAPIGPVIVTFSGNPSGILSGFQLAARKGSRKGYREPTHVFRQLVAFVFRQLVALEPGKDPGTCWTRKGSRMGSRKRFRGNTIKNIKNIRKIKNRLISLGPIGLYRPRFWVATGCHGLPRVATTCRKLPRVGTSCHGLPQPYKPISQ